MNFLWFLLILTVYLVIGGVIDEVTGKDLDGVIFFWPLFVFFFIAIETIRLIRAVASLLVNMFNHIIFKGEQNEKQEED